MRLRKSIGHIAGMQGSSTKMSWYSNLADDATDSGLAAFANRLYLEQTELRKYLAYISEILPSGKACDIGAGYGRMSPVLREYCRQVVAFEREPEMLAQGSILNPAIEFRQIEALDILPAGSSEFDLALTFTVLQHLEDSIAKKVIAEIKRVVGGTGCVLICEETDGEYVYKDPRVPDQFFTIGRSIDVYKAWMSPFVLIRQSPRIIECTCPRANVGTFMLFRAPQGAAEP